MRYAIVVEEGPESFGAYVPDLHGCVAAGQTREEVLALIRQAIEFHLEGMREDGLPVSAPRSSAKYVKIAAAHHGEAVLIPKADEMLFQLEKPPKWEGEWRIGEGIQCAHRMRAVNADLPTP